MDGQGTRREHSQRKIGAAGLERIEPRPAVTDGERDIETVSAGETAVRLRNTHDEQIGADDAELGGAHDRLEREHRSQAQDCRTRFHLRGTPG